ncbi:HipA family kinase [Metapseudomonas resinovorans]|uniref:HipA family kinase n=1 Tax=Metapseudomonas resinovorans TaxID=53412 RepID=UPI0004904623|nr:HipA family kinase [Pseudomonas resinovorans]
MKARKSALTEPALGIYVNGEQVEGRDLRGKNPLFYGLVRFPGGHQHHAYVKLLPPKQMYAEVLSAALGQHLGLPVPYTSVVIARGADVGLNVAQVVCLASVDTGARPISRIVRPDDVNGLLNKWAHAKTAIVFDELIANADRNLRNLLLGSDGKLWLIDHEEALGEPLSSPHRTICNHLLEKLLTDVHEFERRRSAQLINEKALALNDCDFSEQAMRSLPGPCRVPASFVTEVVEFLQARVHHMPLLIGNSLDLKQHALDLGR